MAEETMKAGVVEECPDLETIAAYLDRRLSGPERDRMADHLASCETCYFVFTEAAQMRSAESARREQPAVTPRSRWAGSWSPRAAAWAATAAMAASVMLLVWTGALPWRASRGSELQALVAAVGPERTIEPRVSGGFAYAPLRAPRRSTDAASGRDVSPDVRIAAANLEKRVFERRTPQTLTALGVAYLVMEDAERAVPLFEEAAERTPNDAQLLSDLSAAYLVRASRGNRPQDLSRALAMADRAVKADHRLSEAWFNRALALERLSLVQEAQDAWREYLTIDSESGWAVEARQHSSRPQ